MSPTFANILSTTLLMDRGKEEEETVVLYFDSWPKEERCVSLPLKQVQHISIFLVIYE